MTVGDGQVDGDGDYSPKRFHHFALKEISPLHHGGITVIVVAVVETGHVGL